MWYRKTKSMYPLPSSSFYVTSNHSCWIFWRKFWLQRMLVRIQKIDSTCRNIMKELRLCLYFKYNMTVILIVYSYFLLNREATTSNCFSNWEIAHNFWRRFLWVKAPKIVYGCQKLLPFLRTSFSLYCSPDVLVVLVHYAELVHYACSVL